jgi:hypothetical protein
VNKSMGAMGGITLLFFALLAAGCGGSSEEALTKSEFVKQGNAICAKATKTREKAVIELIKGADPQTSQKALQREAADIALPPYETAAEEIDDLGAPDGGEAEVEAIVEAMEEAAAQVDANPQTAIAGNLPFRKANKAAESYGLDACVV